MLPPLVAVALMILWAAHNGGFDADTWYWGALVLLAILAASVCARGLRTAWALPRSLRWAVLAFALYVAWSYLSISWAGAPGQALEGSNRALLYFIVFTLFAIAPWTSPRALTMLLIYALGIGVVGAVTLLALAVGHHSASMFVDGRLLSPTGYINSNAALFTTGAFIAIALAARKELPPLLRGVLLAIACEQLQLAVLAQSRGWLFLLPLMVAAAIAVLPARVETAALALIPTAGAVALLPSALAVFRATQDPNATQTAVVAPAEHAARSGLLVCAVILVLGTVLAVIAKRSRFPLRARPSRRVLGTLMATLMCLACLTAGVVATHGHPLPFIRRQFEGITKAPAAGLGSHFAVAGTGRYDIWRVSLEAWESHPIGGLGQDNFIDYDYTRRHTSEEPLWTHSFELRLLAHTGLVGFLLMVTFLAAALTAAIGNRRRGGSGAVAGVALLALSVWLIHGSVDWFWEMPALSGPALGFLGMAAALGRDAGPPGTGRGSTRLLPRAGGRTGAGLAALGGCLVCFAAIVALALPYLSVREVSTATDVRNANPSAALADLAVASKLNPLDSTPGRLAGAIALQAGRFSVARSRFRESITREPGAWFSWLGAGLAASELGDTGSAERDFRVAASIDARQPAVTEALRRVTSQRPLTPAQAFKLLLAVQ